MASPSTNIYHQYAQLFAERSYVTTTTTSGDGELEPCVERVADEWVGMDGVNSSSTTTSGDGELEQRVERVADEWVRMDGVDNSSFVGKEIVVAHEDPIETLKGLLIEVMKGHPELKKMLDDCQKEGSVTITIGELKQKLEEYNRTGGLMTWEFEENPFTNESTITCQALASDNELEILITTLTKFEIDPGHQTEIEIPENEKKLTLTYADISKYSETITSALSYTKNLVYAADYFQTLIKVGGFVMFGTALGAAAVTAVAGVGIFAYNNPWTVLLAFLVRRMIIANRH